MDLEFLKALNSVIRSGDNYPSKAELVRRLQEQQQQETRKEKQK